MRGGGQLLLYLLAAQIGSLRGRGRPKREPEVGQLLLYLLAAQVASLKAQGHIDPAVLEYSI